MYEFHGTVVDALTIIARGWQTEAERVVHNAAMNRVHAIALLAYRIELAHGACRTCGHDPFEGLAK